MVNVSGEYRGGLHCLARHEPSGDVLETDAPRDNQGRGEAFSPTDLVATAFGTCILTTMAIVARKHGVELEGAKFLVSKEMSSELPRRIVRLKTEIWLPPSAAALPAGLLEKAAHSCPVHQSLSPNVDRPIEFHWT